MGRETKFLLAVLGVLGGAFLGVLSLKLLVPRPPAGAGPDVEPHHSLVAQHDIVEPPVLDPRPTRPAAQESRDPFLARSAFESPAAGPEPEGLEERPIPSAEAAPSDDALPAAQARPLDEQPDLLPPASFPAASTPMPPAASPPPSFDPPRRAANTPITGSHVTSSGDTWWSIAERAYGDGRLYRALYAWNRRLDQRVSTAPGTRLEIPPQPKLAAAWPKLMP